MADSWGWVEGRLDKYYLVKINYWFLNEAKTSPYQSTENLSKYIACCCKASPDRPKTQNSLQPPAYKSLRAPTLGLVSVSLLAHLLLFFSLFEDRNYGFYSGSSAPSNVPDIVGTQETFLE